MANTLGPAQQAIRVMAMHLPKTPPASAPAAPMTPANDPASLVLRTLLTTMGHGVTMPGQGTTIQALLEGLRGPR